MDNPISITIDTQSLRQSKDPQATGLAEIMELLQDIRGTLRQERGSGINLEEIVSIYRFVILIERYSLKLLKILSLERAKITKELRKDALEDVKVIRGVVTSLFSHIDFIQARFRK